MKILLSSILILLLTACVGTMDSVIEVEGYSPDNKNCSVHFVESESGEKLHSEYAGPKFNKSIVLGTANLPVDIQLICDGRVEAEVRNIKKTPYGNPLNLRSPNNVQ